MKVAPLWKQHLLSHTGKGKNVPERHQAQQKVIEALRPDLLSGKPGVALNRDQVTALAAELRSALSSYGYKHALQLLALGFEEGARTLGWQVPMPPLPVAFPRERAPFAPRDFGGLAKLRELETLFLEDLEHDPSPDPEARLGQVLFSAIVYGGLLARQCLAPWLEALTSGGARLGDDRLWLEMRAESFTGRATREKKGARVAVGTAVHADEEPAAPRMILRRWFADPLSEVLILRWLTDAEKEPRLAATQSTPARCLTAFLRMQDAGDAVSTASTQDLQTWAATRTRLVVPPFLVEYAAGRTPSVSLPAATWARLRLGKAVPVGDRAIDNEATPVWSRARTAPIVDDGYNLADQPDRLRAVLRLLRPPRSFGNSTRPPTSAACRAGLERFLDDEDSSLSPLVRHIASWAIHLLGPRPRGPLRRRRKRLRPSSVYRYLEAIAWGLNERTSSEDISRLSAPELAELYREIIESKTTLTDKDYTAQRLAGFHAFLTSAFAAPVIDFFEIHGMKAGTEHGVDANVVSFGEFRNLLRVLGGERGGKGRLREIWALVATLGFRCGLRRNEALSLLLGDVMGQADPAIAVRSSRYARTKSAASNRIIALRPLMPKDERERLLRWVEKRVGEDGGRDPQHLLFCADGRPTVPLPAEEIFDPITQALHRVTGDESLRFHHLRHSFATWLLLRLLAPDPLHPSQRPGDQQHGLLAEGFTPSHRAALLGPTTRRRVFYSIATLCGHADPATTALHYLHLCDLAFTEAIRISAALPRFSRNAVQRLTGLSRAHVYRSAAGRGAEGWSLSPYLPSVRRRIGKDLDLTEPLDRAARRPSLKRLPETSAALPPWRLVDMVLRKLETGENPSRLAATQRIPVADIEKWCEAAARIRGMKTRRGASRHVTGERFLFFRARFLHADAELVDRIFRHVGKLPSASRRSLSWGLQIFLEGYSIGAGDMRFSRLPDARAYRDFLRMLGIPDAQVVLLHYPRRGQGTPEAERHRRRWAADLGLPFSQTRPKGRGNDTARDPQGRVGFQVTAAPPTKADRKQQEPRQARPASRGFRHAIYLLSVLLDSDARPDIEP